MNKTGSFYHYVVEPFSMLIHWFGELFNGNFGLSIIVITIIIRTVLAPLMLKQYKNQQKMKEKMELIKPEIDAIQQKLKATKDAKEQQDLQKQMMTLYQKHGVNPLSMGCLPLIIQMPIIMGLYNAIRGSEEIAAHSFLWFNLGHPDILITLIAGIVYYVQFKVSQNVLPEQQRKQMQLIGLISPIMIMFISFKAPAALPLYWSVGGLFLIGQTMLGQKLYAQKKDNIIPAIGEQI